MNEMPEISIVETKNIIRAVKLKYDINLSIFSINILRFKIDSFILNNRIKYSDNLISKILEDKNFFRRFFNEMYKYDLELFRDTDKWKLLRSLCFPDLLKNFSSLKILIPGCSEINELFSMLIFLKEGGYIDKCELEISWYSGLYEGENDAALMKTNLTEIGIENFKRIFPGVELETYFDINQNPNTFDSSLLANHKNINHNYLFSDLDQKYHLILFRNKLINYTAHYQDQILVNLSKCLLKNGIIVFGHRENPFETINNLDIYTCMDEPDRIFKKQKYFE